MAKFLHIGCGPKYKNRTTQGFNQPEWQEIRFDIDPNVSPDFIGSMTDLSAVVSDSFDAIFSSHNIEHLYPHEVSVSLAEFMRVLKPKGFLVITCPDLKSVCQLIANDQLLEAAYQSAAGPISPIDIVYGHRPSMARGNLFMAHRCGFTEKTLNAVLLKAGFANTASLARGLAPFFDLWALASKMPRTEFELRELAAQHFPI